MIVLALGSNLGNREEYIYQALTQLAAHGIGITAVSALYETEPVGMKAQDYFLNAVVRIRTELLPEQLLQLCLTIEQQLGRVRQEHWGPRTIDIDLLLYDEVACQTTALVLPHPRMTERRFVLVPLCDVTASEPVYQGKTAQQLLAELTDTEQVAFYKPMTLNGRIHVGG